MLCVPLWKTKRAVVLIFSWLCDIILREGWWTLMPSTTFTAIKYLGVYLEYGHFFHYSTFYERLCLLLITHDQSKELKLHEYAMTREQCYTNNILPMKKKHEYSINIISFTSKNISHMSYSQYWTKGRLNTSQKLGSRFGVSTTYIISNLLPISDSKAWE